MKILWITNILLPEATSILYGQKGFKSSGGWLVGAAEELAGLAGVKLAVASVSSKVSKMEVLEGEKIRHYVIPLGKGNMHKNAEYEPYFKKIKSEFDPDIVHIHGTEFSHGLAYVDACGSNHVVVSIQGMTSAYYYYYYGISTLDILKNITPRDFVKGTLFSEKRNFGKRGTYEIELLQKVHHVIGRTDWDHARTWAINPDAEYHFCNETLRSEFYSGKWIYSHCVPHTIFLSQGSKPLKGLHQVLKALPLVMKHFPDVQVRIAGQDEYTRNTLFQKMKITGYAKYLKSLVNNGSLNKHITYLGSLDAEGMKREYLSANVFVCPSSIENSPNSLGEAQMLGTPCLASYVGGTMNMIPNKDCGELYRFEETEMLAWQICNIFEKSKDFDNEAMQNEARRRHDGKKNCQTLNNIYEIIVKE